ncbi:OmpA family protein [Chitinophaga dinghuensis]|uniref:OmpA family protein n=1 Tax=Chitinophaga dinghuensis TaxID=1539050 RepID=A0A327VJH6_9BACT|nr:OmpA family protein [Chitinophaga dinghuensis]RAJ72837.1 OmpA family protein [Chitinophaga dinghuensis]
MKSILTTLLLCCSWMSVFAQNLLPNPGFNEVNICIEYAAKCAPRAWYPTAPFFSKVIYNGEIPSNNHSVTLIMENRANTSFRPYYKTQLLNPLQKGTRYKLEVFWLNTANASTFLDIKLDTTETFQDIPVQLAATPTVHLTKSSPDKPKEGWITSTATFTAAENYRYLVMGNFSAPTTAKHPRDLYCYIDSIAVTPLDGQTYNTAMADSIRKLLYNDRWRHSYSSPSASLNQAALKPKLQLPLRVIQRSGKCDTVVISPEFFSGNRKEINDVYADQLGSVFTLKPEDVREKIYISGYSYRKPNSQYNEIIATDRANEVAKYLVYNMGFSFDDFVITGYSRLHPGIDSIEIISCQSAVEKPVPVAKTDTLVIPDILFKFDSSALNQLLYASLDSLLRHIPAIPGIQLAITGHTDNKGTALYNMDLSMRRAVSVAEYVRRKHPQSAITAINGMGESMPVADNSTSQGRQKNRRVEIIIFYPDH